MEKRWQLVSQAAFPTRNCGSICQTKLVINLPPSRPEAQNSDGTWTIFLSKPWLSSAAELTRDFSSSEVGGKRCFGEERACVTFCSVSDFHSHPGGAVSTRCLQMLPHSLRVEEDTLMIPPDKSLWAGQSYLLSKDKQNLGSP